MIAQHEYPVRVSARRADGATPAAHVAGLRPHAEFGGRQGRVGRMMGPSIFASAAALA